MSKNLFNKIIIYAVILFLLAISPSIVNMPSQTSVRAICTGLALDKENGQVSVSAQILIPEAGGQYTQKLTMVNHSGSTVEYALKQIEAQVGKKVRFAHCCFIILSDTVCNDNLTNILDYFVRGNNIGNNTILIYTDKSAKDLLSHTSNVNSNEVDNLQVITKYNEKHLFSNGANLLSFFDDYLAPHHTAFMANITMKNDSGQSGGGDSGQSGGSGGSGSGSGGESSDASSSTSGANSPQQDTILSDGQVAVFYKGKLAKLLSNEEREQFNWLDPEVLDTFIKIENVSDKVFENATLAYTVRQKGMKFEYEIANNTPTIRVHYDLGLRAEMILQENGESLAVNQEYISDVVVDAISRKIDEAVKNVCKIQSEYGFDLFNFYRSFNINCHNDWQNYLKLLGDDENYMKNVQIFTDVTCHSAF